MRKKLLEGSVKRHPDGFGFFIPDNKDEPDVYIPRHCMTGVMANDRVKVEVTPEPGGHRFRGDIIEILSRAQTKVVGVFSPLNAKFGMIRDEGHSWGADLRIPIADSNHAKKGQLVAAEVISYPDDKDGFQGRVTEIIGDSADPLTDVKRVLISNYIPHEWPAPVTKEAHHYSEHVDKADMQGRKDIRELKFITIDGATAKDFDDAILVKSTTKGFRLYVAIADVSHYVRPGSAIDKEAYTRGTSVYFPNFVVPMLPEVLSNGLCSLNPHLPRLALVAEMEMDFHGQVYASHFYEAVIESKARVTYGEAQEIVDGNQIEKLKHVQSEILLAADLAKILMAKRFREGALDLEIPETQIVLDSAGLVTDMVRSERLFAHRLIEEMMLAANVEVAKFIAGKQIPGLYRIHDQPNAEAISMLERYIHNFGGKEKLTGGKLQKRLTKSLQDFEGKPEALILNILTLRSMSQAKYSPANIGHFGLGFEFYSHFTSPIRRYPDLIVHRLIKSQVLHSKAYRVMTEDELGTAGVMLSACEQRSVKAERQFVSIKKARFIQQHLGEEFDGMISSVTKFGVFVLLRQFEVDGLCRAESLSKEKLWFDEDTLQLIGKRSGARFSIGDQVRIRVDKAEPDSGQIDFGFVGKLDATGALEIREIFTPRSERFEKKRPHGREPQRSHRSERSHGKDAPRRSEKGSGKSRKAEYLDSKQKQGRSDGAKQTHHKASNITTDKSANKPAHRQHRSGGRPTETAGAAAKHHARPIEKQAQKPVEAPKKRSGFDPVAHFENAMAKWKQRKQQNPSLKQPGRHSLTDKVEDEDSEALKTSAPEKLQFGKFDKITGKKKTTGRGNRKRQGFRK